MSRPAKRDYQRALVVNPAFQQQCTEQNEFVHEEDMEPTLMKAPQARGTRRVNKRENINVIRECEWDVKNRLERGKSLNRPLAALVGVLCLASIVSLVLTLLILFGSVGIKNCNSCSNNTEDDDRIQKMSEKITTLDRKLFQ
ncbi:hypothetical protein ACROYT_G040830 [Oculina patagonica]